MDLAAKVYDPTGEVVYARKVRGEHSNRLWLSSGKMKFGQLLAEAVDKALVEILADPKFTAALGPARP